MSSTLLTEYRCSCGKLLFKGLLCQCVVEVKCRRCGSMTTWGLAEEFPYALIESDADAWMTCVSGDIENVLGCDREYLIGRPITDIFPFIRDVSEKGKAPDRPEQAYDLKDAALMLRDGQERSVEGCVVPRYQGETFTGYRVFCVPKRAQGV